MFYTQQLPLERYGVLLTKVDNTAESVGLSYLSDNQGI